MIDSLKTVFRREADATLARYERALKRERVLRDAASMLSAAGSRKAIHRIAVNSALALTDGSLQRRIWLVLGSGEDVAVASAGTSPASVRAADGLPAMGVTAVFTASLSVKDIPRGALVVMSESELPAESKEALTALAAQVAFALEMSDLTEELRNSEAIYRDLFENATDVIFTSSLHGEIESINGAIENLTGHSVVEARAAGVVALVAPGDRDRLVGMIRTTVRSKRTATFELEILSSSGRHVPIELTTRVIRSEGRTVGIHGIARDITERKAAEAALQHQATHDALTGLPGRSLLRERLETAVAQALATGARPALIFVDLNRFKEVNDTYGHHCGDLLLQTAGERLVRAVGAAGMVARLGGDEFAALLHDAKPEAATLIAARVAACLDEDIVIEGHHLDVSGSVGVACYPEHGADALELMRHADEAMYVAKRGRLPYMLFRYDLDVVSREDRRNSAEAVGATT